ncbi:surface lipoprotein assembly modifier [Zavarzinia aquatilis]|uniref:Surface lipoprotein assembly modifier C-terminal domain-containing protein n=1 Tax=Zavarzinia aquatilis TaxID=2211142 RepID=A0A317EEP2_9PROT|nr:surface lipoprotein assembly modifier [Zavarzinia aquatilis]PWR25508.1 hypothetical protein DKG74_00595 [Zavarzinia aquatilis]
MSSLARLAGGALLLLGLAFVWPAQAQEPQAEPTAEQLRTEAEFREGLQAVAGGDYAAAIAIFDAILARDASLVRVRLELARALFLAGDQDERARFQFERVLSADLPQAVQDNVEKFLNAIRKRRRWTLSAELAIVPDSNINGGPDSREVNLVWFPGRPFELSDSATRKSGVGLYSAVNGSYRFDLADHWRLQTSGGLSQRTFTDSEFDDTVLSVTTGPRYLLERGEIGIGLTAYHCWYGLDPYNRFVGLQIDGNYLLSRSVRAEAAFRIGDDRSALDFGRDGLSTDGSVTLRYAVLPELLLYTAASAQREDFDNAFYANVGAGLTAGIYGDLPWGFSAGGSIRVARTWYDGYQPAFATTREDESRQYTAFILNRRINVWRVTPSLRYTHIDNDSNIPIYSYGRDLFQIGVTKEF